MTSASQGHDADPLHDDRKGQCHSNKENLVTSLNGMKWADQIFPGGGLVWKQKRHILVLLDEKAGTDRKSTRLNSSHVSISYAVFCLKKKNLDAHEVCRT